MGAAKRSGKSGPDSLFVDLDALGELARHLDRAIRVVHEDLPGKAPGSVGRPRLEDVLNAFLAQRRQRHGELLDALVDLRKRVVTAVETYRNEEDRISQLARQAH